MAIDERKIGLQAVPEADLSPLATPADSALMNITLEGDDDWKPGDVVFRLVGQSRYRKWDGKDLPSGAAVERSGIVNWVHEELEPVGAVLRFTRLAEVIHRGVIEPARATLVPKAIKAGVLVANQFDRITLAG